MAFVLNTVTYAWETNPVAQSGSVAYNTPIKRIYIPETGSRTFLSVDVEMYMRDANNGSTISNITATALSCSVDGNLSGQPAVSRTVTMTGDHTTLLFKDTFTDLFNQRFTGSNHDVTVRWQTPHANAGPWIGHSFRLICTYQYDNAGVETNIKTVALPLDAYYGTVGTMLDTLAPFGSTSPGYTNIPALDTFLPESNKIIRGYWIEYTGVDAGNATTDVNMFTQLDSGSEITRFVLQGNMNSDTYYFDIQTGSFYTSTAHTLKGRASLTGRLTTISPTLYVTYEYDATSSKTINSCIIPFNMDYYKLYNMIHQRMYGYVNFVIPEPDPWLAHSAWVTVQPATVTGTKTYTVNGINIISFNYARGSVQGSPNKFNIRFDQNAKMSASVQLRGGYNTISTALIGPQGTTTGHSGYFLLNYTASALQHPYRHNRTIYLGSGSQFGKSGGGVQLFNRPFVTQSIHGEITQSYFSNGFLGFSEFNVSTEPTPIVFAIEYTGSTGVSSSLIAYDGFTGRGTEMGMSQTPFEVDVYKRYNTEPDAATQYRGNYFAPVNYGRFDTNVVISSYWRSDYFTMNQNKISVTGSLLNCNFASQTYNLKIYLSGSNVPTDAIAVTTSSGSGASKKFYFDWYENINNVYAVSTGPEYGISNFATASQGDILTIDFSTPSGGGETSHTWVG